MQLYLQNIVWKNDEIVTALTMVAPAAVATPPCTEQAQGRLIRSLSIADRPTHACITASEQWGGGVFSWHDSYNAARYNAGITGGVAVSVDCYEGMLDKIFEFRSAVANTTVYQP